MIAEVSTWLVVPCFNEADRLPADSFLAFIHEHPTIGFLFVDDGSTDGTLAVLTALADRIPGQFEALHTSKNNGKAEAVRLGVQHILATRPADIIGFWDADLATPLSAIDELVGLLETDPEAQILLGSRVRMLGRRIERNEFRHYVGRVAATVASGILGLPVYDTQCGAKLLRVSDAVRDVFATPFLTKWTFDVEILARWMLSSNHGPSTSPELGLREFPLPQWSDIKGSKLRWTDFMRAPIDLLTIRRGYGRQLRERRQRSGNVGTASG